MTAIDLNYACINPNRWIRMVKDSGWQTSSPKCISVNIIFESIGSVLRWLHLLWLMTNGASSTSLALLIHGHLRVNNGDG